MHRSRLPVLVILAAAAACSTHDDPEGTAILSRDSTLVARLAADSVPPQPLPAACGAITVAARPAAASKTQAEQLTRQAYDAEIMGNVQEARSLLVRASGLDGTNKSAAYHLGLTNETLGDHPAAISAYCHYLALTPTTTESAEARQRVAKLSQSVTHVAAGSVAESVPPRRRVASASVRRVTPARSAVRPRSIERVAVARSSMPVSSSARVTRSTSSSSASDADVSSASRDIATTSDASAGASGTTSQGDVYASPPAEPSVEQPAASTHAQRRGVSRAQSAGIGAAAGAMIGAVTGRSVKGAVIGAAAGGILGTVVGGRIR